MENLEPNRSLTWEFGDNDNSQTSPSEESVSEVMEFFEMAASLIRTLAPDSAPKSHTTPTPTITATVTSIPNRPHAAARQLSRRQRRLPPSRPIRA